MASVDPNLEELMSYLGEFGKYQGFQFSLHVVSGLLAGLHMLSLLTVAAQPKFKCVVPGLQEKLGGLELTYENVPGVHNRFENGSEPLKGIPLLIDECHYQDLDNNTQTCAEFVWDKTYYKSSRVIEWNLVCSNRWKHSLSQTAYMFGVFTGAVTLGSLADKYGRKIIFCISSTATLFLGTLVAFTPEYYSFLVLRYLYGIFGSAGAYITGFVLTMELVGASKRTVCGIMFQFCFAIGAVVVAFWGFVITDRMWLQIIYGLHNVITIGHWWLMDESPRWLWAQGRAKETINIIQKALKMNGDNTQLDVAKYVSKNKAKSVARESEKTYGAADLFKTPNMRRKCLNVCLNWFANSIVYYGLSLSSGNMEGSNPFLMMALFGLVEIPSYVLTVLTMDRLGRRCLVCTFMIIGGLCCILAAMIPKESSSGVAAAIGIALLGKSCIAISFAVIYNYTAELFPTVVRNTAIGIGSMCCRLSGALTPFLFLLDSLSPSIPATIFGLIALTSGFLATFLPETVGHPMPETIEDGEKFGIGDSCFSTGLGRRKHKSDIMLPQINDKPVEAAVESQEKLSTAPS